ncbi:MAG: ribulose-phosphate 3-epimerase [Candidatus Omnitrophota bacterium]
MAKKVFIAPSLLSADFSDLAGEIKAVEDAGADWLHVDVMDGVFVPNITIGPCVIKSVRKITEMLFDVHLMIDDPGRYVKAFSDAGADIITFHVEACKSPEKTIKAIRDEGRKAGLSVRPGTPVSRLKPYLGILDMVLIMSVEPGFGGQSFMHEVIPKITELRKMFMGDIEVDGGITAENVSLVHNAGANVIVAGTAVFGSADYKQTIRRLRNE